MVFEQPLVNKPNRLSSPHPYFSSYRVDTSFFENSLGILLTDFNKAQVLAKDAVNPKWQKDQKNRCNTEQMAPPNLKRSSFVFLNDNSKP